ncbi:hypothetical protein IE4803_PD00381 (plasmid) [Rhizobium etli bv. phaseoli str. IE4803]|uniref:Uncharacterized protein n=1 Tax=Rhizobium etli bv. mimosae str. IE4771 TaxID=1432050 RepID=A0A060II99_RHIET|nr:hypothetical protein IE4771_PE00396 [Rhizobium sp. IE4771]AJC83580.1 hypothetical protein IE4803_PD00381 [Rhizobium etli bv. phaseoli str. IE4803]
MPYPGKSCSGRKTSSASSLQPSLQFGATVIIRSIVAHHGVRRLTSNIVSHLRVRRKREVYSTSNSWSSKYGGNRPTRIF